MVTSNVDVSIDNFISSSCSGEMKLMLKYEFFISLNNFVFKKNNNKNKIKNYTLLKNIITNNLIFKT